MTQESIVRHLEKREFVPHRALRNPHAQTLAGALLPRRLKLIERRSEARFFDTSPGVSVLARCSWQDEPRAKPTVVLAHGLEGSTESRYMQGTAERALAAGFNAVRVNHRNCGGTEHLTPTLYHAGLTDDFHQIIAELTQRDGLSEIYLAGFSLGGNIVLKVAGEYGSGIPSVLRGVVAISPSLDLGACADSIAARRNRIYSFLFLRSLRKTIRRKARLFPDSYDASRLSDVRTLRQFDDAYVAPHCGFRDADDYYYRASSLRVVDRISVPTLILHAKDDPLLPFSQFQRPEVTSNPNLRILAPDKGGHVGFISENGKDGVRFWAESTAIEFLELVSADRHVSL